MPFLNTLLKSKLFPVRKRIDFDCWKIRDKKVNQNSTIFLSHSYLKRHICVTDFWPWEHIEAERPGEILFLLTTPLEGANSDLERYETLHLILDFLVPFLYSVVLVVIVVETYIVAYRKTEENIKYWSEKEVAVAYLLYH